MSNDYRVLCHIQENGIYLLLRVQHEFGWREGRNLIFTQSYKFG